MGSNWRQSTPNRAGDDRFGYRPTPEKRKSQADFAYKIGRTARQELLDKIQLDQLKRQWRSENEKRGREGWENFGNPDLPVMRHKDDIMKMLANNRISLLAGETGSGKSTQLAQYALEMGYDHIVYLQPRRVTTDGISERIDEELSVQFNDKNLKMPKHLVGMAHSDHATLRDDSVIQVMTSAVFKKRAPELETEWRGKRVLIVADEVHEGNIETEFAVATAAEMMTEHDRWNMVLMSATLNENEIQQAYMPINGKPIPRVVVEGRPHDISYNERPEDTVVDVYDAECVDANKTLIFTDGKRSIGAIKNELQRRHPDLRILALHSKITESERRAIFHDSIDQKTAIISTSAGQSGITIPGVDRVISDGWTKSPELDAENASGLPRRLCTQAELIQQMGRGGRDIDGAAFFLAQPLPHVRRHQDTYHADDFTELEHRLEHIPADIYHTVITRNVLSAAAMNRDFYNLNDYLIHKVTKGTIEEAYTVLRLMGAVDESSEVTEMGREMDKYPLRPELARAVAESVSRGSVAQKHQMAAIAASIEAGGLASYDPSQLELARKHLSTDTKDDFLAQLDYFMGSMKYLEEGNAEDSLAQAGFDAKNVLRAHKQYRKICRSMGLDGDRLYENLENTLSTEDRIELQKMLITGMPHMLYHEVGRKKWRGRLKRNPDGSREPHPPIVWYRNVIAPDKATPYEYDRQVSKRSVLAKLAIGKSEIIAGYPRWYIDDDDNLHNVIERGISTTKTIVRSALGRAALSVRDETAISADGRLKSVSTSSIGQLSTRRDVRRAVADNERRVELLSRAALEKPGPAQRELRDLKRALGNLAERVPKQQMSYFFDRPPISQHDLEAMITEAARGVASLGELDATLRQQMVEQSISIEHYISSEKWQSIEENMPTSIDIGDWTYDVSYEGEEASPYISGFNPSHGSTLPDKLTIRDGREIRFRYKYGDDDYRYLTASDVKAMSS